MAAVSGLRRRRWADEWTVDCWAGVIVLRSACPAILTRSGKGCVHGQCQYTPYLCLESGEVDPGQVSQAVSTAQHQASRPARREMNKTWGTPPSPAIAGVGAERLRLHWGQALVDWYLGTSCAGLYVRRLVHSTMDGAVRMFSGRWLILCANRKDQATHGTGQAERARESSQKT